MTESCQPLDLDVEAGDQPSIAEACEDMGALDLEVGLVPWSANPDLVPDRVVEAEAAGEKSRPMSWRSENARRSERRCRGRGMGSGRRGSRK